MHMADALISPPVGAVFWLASAGLIGHSARTVSKDEDHPRRVPLMGVLGAFIFAAQMINFSIPGTGSSGHIGGGILLAVLLGPHAAFLVMAAVLTVQAFFFADGGLLALGCNIFNLGFFPCFVAYPLLYKKITGTRITPARVMTGSLLASVVGLQLGSFGVVFQTVVSGISELPVGTFLLLMQPIHLAIGIGEGLITAAVVGLVGTARPEVLQPVLLHAGGGGRSLKNVLAGLAAAAVISAGALSWFASTHPDGLEWAIFKTSGVEELKRQEPVYTTMAALQEKTALWPDYGFKQSGDTVGDAEPAWPAVDPGTSLSGLFGGAITFAVVLFIGLGVRRRPVTT